MNERIAQLAEQAAQNSALLENETNLEVIVGDDVSYHVPATFIKMFAELIVRECTGVCDDERDSTDSEFGKLVAEGCAMKIMERFGVEQ